MSGTNPVATYAQTNYTVDTGTVYKTKIDSNFIVAQRVVDNFAPRQTTSPAMTITLDAGHVFDGVTLTEVATQTSGTITAPIGNPRIDRAVIDRFTGTLSIVTGTPAGSPVAPAIPSGKVPVAQILLQTTSTSITNSMITDERDLSALGRGTAGEENIGAWLKDDGSGNLTINVNATLKDDGAGKLTTTLTTESTISSGTTTDLGTCATNVVEITGTTTITSFGTTASTANPLYFVRFNGALTLTNGSNLILPGAANITTAAGDFLIAKIEASNVWRVIAYYRANGQALVGGVTFAVKSDQTTGTSTTVAVNPAVQQYHNSAAKAWCFTTYSGSTPSASASYNISSITNNGTGDLTYNFTVPFSSANYAYSGTAKVTGAVFAGVYQSPSSDPATGSCQMRIANTGNGSSVNANHSVSFFGAQ